MKIHWLCRWFGHKFKASIIRPDYDLRLLACCERCGFVANYYEGQQKQEGK